MHTITQDKLHILKILNIMDTFPSVVIVDIYIIHILNKIQQLTK